MFDPHGGMQALWLFESKCTHMQPRNLAQKLRGPCWTSRRFGRFDNVQAHDAVAVKGFWRQASTGAHAFVPRPPGGLKLTRRPGVVPCMDAC